MKSIFNFGAANDDDDDSDSDGSPRSIYGDSDADDDEPSGMMSPMLEGILDYARLLGGDNNDPGWNINGAFAPHGFAEVPPPTMAELLTTQKPVGILAPLRFNPKPAAPFRLRLK